MSTASPSEVPQGLMEMRLLYKVGVLEYGGGDVPERYDLTALLGDGALFIPGSE